MWKATDRAGRLLLALLLSWACGACFLFAEEGELANAPPEDTTVAQDTFSPVDSGTPEDPDTGVDDTSNDLSDAFEIGSPNEDAQMDVVEDAAGDADDPSAEPTDTEADSSVEPDFTEGDIVEGFDMPIIDVADTAADFGLDTTSDDTVDTAFTPDVADTADSVEDDPGCVDNGDCTEPPNLLCGPAGECQDGNEGDPCAGRFTGDCGESAPHCGPDNLCHDGSLGDPCWDSGQCNLFCTPSMTCGLL